MVLCQEGWWIMYCSQLTEPQWYYYQRFSCTSHHRRICGSICRKKCIHSTGYVLGISCLNDRCQMQRHDSIPDSTRNIPTHITSYGIHQCSSRIWGLHDIYSTRWSTWYSRGIHWQHPITGPATHYLTPEGKSEVIPENPGIRRYMWEHLNDVHWVLHRIIEAGGTVSAKKMQLFQSKVTIVGHKCSAKGREPVDDHIQKVLDWPIPINVKEVCGFFKLCGTVQIWVKDYSIIAKLLVDLTRKGAFFVWTSAQEEAFEDLKEIITRAPALWPIDYHCDRPIYLSVDSSIHGIGYILSQEDEHGWRVPAQYWFNSPWFHWKWVSTNHTGVIWTLQSPLSL